MSVGRGGQRRAGPPRVSAEPLIPDGRPGHRRTYARLRVASRWDSDQLFEALRKQCSPGGLDDVAVRRVGCLGLCAAGPLVEVPEQGRLFERVQPGEPEA